MKATVRASELSKAMKKAMKSSSSPRLIFGDDDLFVLGREEPAIKVEGAAVLSTGWSHLEYDRAEKVMNVLDLQGENTVTFSYHRGRHFVFENLIF